MPSDHSISDWGTGWRPAEPGEQIDLQLGAELTGGHPLAALKPRVLGRCLACDDVVLSLTDAPGEVAVVHLTWQDRSTVKQGDQVWPYYERLPTAQFVERFVVGGEHL